METKKGYIFMFGIGKVEEIIVLLMIVGVLTPAVAMGIKVLGDSKLNDVAKVLWILGLIFLFPLSGIICIILFAAQSLHIAKPEAK